MNWTILFVMLPIVVIGLVALFTAIEEFPEIDSVDVDDSDEDS